MISKIQLSTWSWQGFSADVFQAVSQEAVDGIGYNFDDTVHLPTATAEMPHVYYIFKLQIRVAVSGDERG